MTTPRKPFKKSALAIAAMLVVGVAPTQEALAASCTWNPATGNWGSPGGWSCGAVPTGPANDSATIGLGKTVTVNTAQSIFTLFNAGTIDIDAFTFALQGGGSTTNTGTINVGSGSTAALQMSNSIDNSGGFINIANGSVLNQFTGAITGGTISTAGTGALVAFSSGNNLLSGVTFNGLVDAATIANSRERIGNGMTLNGAVNIANGGIVSFDATLGAANSIGGSGSFNLNDAGARLALEGSGTTTLGAGIVVRGQGNIGTALIAGGTNLLVNNGRISADVNGGTLTITPPAGSGSVTNNGLLDARNGGTLVLAANVNNAAGQINAANASTVVHNGVTISGGLISTAGSGSFAAASSGNNFLDGVKLNGGAIDMTVIANSRERIVNGATLNGAVNIGNGGILSFDSANTTGGSQTILGTGTINLNDAGARLAVDGTGSTTLGAGITVRGQGNFGLASYTGGNNTLTLNGLVSADVSGGTLNIVAPANGGGSSFVNNGTLQAVNGGTLLLSTNIASNAGSQIVAGAGSAVVQNGVKLNGVITAGGSGVFSASSSASNVLDGVTFAGTLDLNSTPNSRERFVNGATVNGVVNIANGGIASFDSVLTTGGNQAIGGTATFNLNDAGARLAVDGTGTTTLGSGITVRGQGNFGQAINFGGNNTLVNNGLVLADVSGGTLNIVPPGNGGGSSFVNNGTLRAINGGTLLLSTNIASNTGSQIVAGAGSAVVQNGVTLNGVINVSGTGSFQAISSGNNMLDGVNFTGTLDTATIANSRERFINGATVNGAVIIANGGIVSFDSFLTTGGSQTIGGNASFNLNDPGARLAVDGTGSTTLGAGITVRGQGNFGQAINIGGDHTLTLNGLVSADVGGGTLNIVTPGNGGGSSFVNNGTLQAINGGTLLLSTNITSNAGSQIVAGAGSVVVQNGVTLNGVINVSGTGSFQATSSGNNVFNGVNFSGALDATSIANSRERFINGATLNGAVNIANGGIVSFDSALTTGGNQAIGGTATFNLNDAGARLAVDGTGSTTLGAGITVRGQGNFGQAINTGGNNTLVNNGRILADGGTLTVSTPGNGGASVLTGTGTLQTSGGTLNLATANASTQGRLLMGGTGSALNLNTQNLTITNDYTNAQSGTGNAFDRRAGVSGTGQILAGGNAAQAVTGAGVTNGNTGNATLTLGNVRVGATTFDYQVANTGSSGPSLRGAIQTSVNGANLSDARLSGTGVTAASYNTGAPGSNTGNLGVTITVANSGLIAPLTGQVLNLRSNFDNVADQKLNIMLGSAATAYNAAVGSASTPLQLANQRINGSNSAVLSVSNTAPSGAFSEDLNASFGGASGAATGSGNILGRLAGTSNTGSGAITVGVDTSTAGARTGGVTLNYQTTGTVNGVSNGLGVASVGSQVVTVNGNVFQAAAGAIQTAALNFGTVQVGQSVSQNLVIRNTAVGTNGFVEDLNVSFGSPNGTGSALISGTGSLNGIGAGTNSTGTNGLMTVAVNTANAGVVNGGIAVNYFTAGSVNGLGNGLGSAAVGGQNYGVAGSIEAVGNVINQASPLVNNPAINLGAMRVGDASPTAKVSVTNVATTPPQAALNASISSSGGPVFASGGFNLLAPGSTSANQLTVGLNTAVAGNYTGGNAGSATIAFVSDASNVGNCAPHCQLDLAPQLVSVSGKVYTPAVAQLNTASVDFGIVHRGDLVSLHDVSISNAASATAANDTLRGSAGSASSPFTASGSFSDLAAQGTAGAALQVGLNTGVAGVFNGSASANFASHDAELADLALGSQSIRLKGQVNNYAEAALAKTGEGQWSAGNHTYTLDFGTVQLGSGEHSASLSVLNAAIGPADLLSGNFDLTGLGPNFTLNGFGSFADLIAGDAFGGLNVLFASDVQGAFLSSIVLHGSGSNASGYVGQLDDTTLVLRGDVNVVAVPEPGTYVLMFAGLLVVVGASKARRRQAAARAA
ncbi:MAG: choice-of-anchor D domain-containing protein [Bacteriovorax sp.]|nr:choice-of-anchor D domain-containing protein [Rhizobacter sp.]